MDTKIIFFFELNSKLAIFFFRSLVFIKSETKEYSVFETYFFNGEELNFSSINKTRLDGFLINFVFIINFNRHNF